MSQKGIASSTNSFSTTCVRTCPWSHVGSYAEMTTTILTPIELHTALGGCIGADLQIVGSCLTGTGDLLKSQLVVEGVPRVSRRFRLGAGLGAVGSWWLPESGEVALGLAAGAEEMAFQREIQTGQLISSASFLEASVDILNHF